MNEDHAGRPALCVDDVLITSELEHRPQREPDYSAENRALSILAQDMAQHPEQVLQRVSDLAMEICRADSAGISILEPGGEHGIFRWHAASGAFAPNRYGTIERDKSPCGTVIERNQVLLLGGGERFFPAMKSFEPRIYESLLTPWTVNGQPIGTLWVMMHRPDGCFDAEDARLLTSLSRFASAAYQMVTALQSAQNSRRELEHRNSEALVRSLFAHLPGGAAFVVDHDLRYILAGGEAFEAAGFDPEDFIGHRLNEVLPPGLEAEHTSYYRQALKGEPFTHEHEAHGRVYLTRGVPLRDHAGDVYGALAVSYDITDRRRAEEASRESESRLRLIVESARDYAVFTMDPEGTVVDWYPGAETVFGYSAHEIRSRSADILFTAEDRGICELQKELELARTDGTAPDIRWHVHQDGREVFIDGHVTSLRNRGGQLTGFLKIGQDVTDRRRAEEALRASEENYRTLFSSIDEGFCTIEILFDDAGEPFDYRFLEVNPAFVRQTGLTNVTGKTVRELVPQHEAFWFDLYGRIVKTKTPLRFEHESAALGKFFDIYAFRIGASEGNRIAVLFSDILARKRVEDALRKSEERFRLLTVASSEIVYRMSADWQKMYALEGKTFLADTRNPSLTWFEEYIPDSDKVLVQATVAEAVRAKAMFELEHRVIRANGSIGWVFSRAIPFLNERSEIVEWFGAASDITDRKHAEEKLRDSEERLRLLVKNVQEYALVQTDPEGKVTSWNPGAGRLFGFTDAEMLGQVIDRLLTPEDRQTGVFAKEFVRVRDGEHAEDVRWLVRKDGSRFWAQWITEPVYDEAGHLRGVAKVLRDETERKQAHERQRLLMGELNHRVKNTLATVQAIANQTLQSGVSPSEFVFRFLGRLQALAQAHNLLTRVSWEAADIADILREQLTLNGDNARISLSGPPALLSANSALSLALVMHELGTNARKYGALSLPGGHVVITWSVDDEEDGQFLHLVWIEAGGPLLTPPEKQGFGTALIRHSLARVGGDTELQFLSQGLHCDIRLPLVSNASNAKSKEISNA